MIDSGRHLGLAQEPLPERVIRAQLGRQHLQRDRRSESGMLCAVNDAHPPTADHRLEQVVAELTSDDQFVSHG